MLKNEAFAAKVKTLKSKDQNYSDPKNSPPNNKRIHTKNFRSVMIEFIHDFEKWGVTI